MSTQHWRALSNNLSNAFYRMMLKAETRTIDEWETMLCNGERTAFGTRQN